MALSDALDDIKDGADDLKGASKDFNKSHGKFKKSSKSIIKAAKGNIFEFPVFASSSVPLDYATASVSLVEQVYASYLQMAISINPIIDDEMARKGAQFDHLRSDTNKYLECVDPTDMPYAYDACHNVFVEDGMRVEFNLVNIEDSMARIINEAVDHQPLSEFDHFFNEAYTGDGAGFFDGCEFIQESESPDPIKPDKNNTTQNTKKIVVKEVHSRLNDVWDDLSDDKKTTYFNGSKAQFYKIFKDDTIAAMQDLRQVVSNDQFNQMVEHYCAAKQAQIALDNLEAEVDYNGEKKKIKDLMPIETVKRLEKLADEAAMVKYDKDHQDEDHTERINHLKAQTKQLEAATNKINEEMKTYDKDYARKVDKENAEIAKLIGETLDKATRLKWDEADREDKVRKNKAEADKAEKEAANYDEDRDIRNSKTKAEIERLKREDKWAKEDRELDRMKKMNDARVKTPQFLDETKIQKLNTMKPLMMSVDLNVVDKNGSLSRPVSYVIGVKCHTRLIDADILPEVAAYPLKEMNKKLRKVKWRAGELKFGRDILWKKTSKKQTASDSRDPKRKWYRRLYELAHMSGDGTAAASIKNGKSPWANWWQDKLTGGNNKDVGHGLIPNATIIMSKSDIDNIKREKDIDLLSGSKASKFCKELFLIGLIVIDDDKEAVKVMFPDLHDDYEVHSLAAIKKQLATLDTAGTKTRDIMKILG